MTEKTTQENNNIVNDNNKKELKQKEESSIVDKNNSNNNNNKNKTKDEKGEDNKLKDINKENKDNKGEDDEIESLLNTIRKRDSEQHEFIQAVEEVINSLKPLLKEHSKYINVLKRMVEPERAVMFRVSWLDDNGKIQVNRGYRVQFNSAIGPYKGGLRFHPSVNLSVMKFLGFEQILKNSLTGLSLGGAKGGSDFNKKGKSEREVMSFCQSFMTELYKYIGPETDVPAGDIGVGTKEIGFLFGQYKRIVDNYHGSLTGKALEYSGSKLRTEATGYGAVIFLNEMLKYKGESLEGKVVLVSGAGNVAQHCVEHLIKYKAKAITMSDSSGYVLEPDGFTQEQLNFIKELKNERNGRMKEYCEFSKSAKYFDGEKPWKNNKCDIAMPCATQNEVEEEDAKALLKNGCKYVAEGANMPCNSKAIHFFLENDIFYGPGKAVNSGGVAVSGLEMAQNSIFLQWTSEEVYNRLKDIMIGIFNKCKKEAEKYDLNYKEEKKVLNLELGANIAGFKKVAKAMNQQGCV
ncbi:hypothetical protein ABK040_010646 [Willaertia magna]